MAPLAYGPSHGPPPAVSRRRSAIQLEERETVQDDEERSARSLYGIDGPRRRPTQVTIDAEAVVQVPDAPRADSVEPLGPVEPVETVEPVEADAGRLSATAMWRAESIERAERRDAAAGVADLEERFDALRIELEAALDRRIRVAVDQMVTTFDQEVEALRTLNREEAKRVRSTNDEAFVRIRVANTTELERIRAAIDEGVARLCSVLEGQLDRIWSANDIELERIRSAGADRLAEVHDLLRHQLDQIRTVHPLGSDHPTVDRHWLRRKRTRTPAAH